MRNNEPETVPKNTELDSDSLQALSVKRLAGLSEREKKDLLLLEKLAENEDPAGIVRLVSAAKTSNEIRTLAIEALFDLSPDRSQILRLISHESGEVRRLIMHEILKLCRRETSSDGQLDLEPEFAKTFIAATRDKDPKVRALAFSILGNVGSQETREFLATAYRTTKGADRINALSALSLYPKEEDLALFVSALSNKNEELLASQGLANLGERTGAEKLASLLRDPNNLPATLSIGAIRPTTYAPLLGALIGVMLENPSNTHRYEAEQLLQDAYEKLGKADGSYYAFLSRVVTETNVSHGDKLLNAISLAQSFGIRDVGMIRRETYERLEAQKFVDEKEKPIHDGKDIIEVVLPDRDKINGAFYDADRRLREFLDHDQKVVLLLSKNIQKTLADQGEIHQLFTPKWTLYMTHSNSEGMFYGDSILDGDSLRKVEGLTIKNRVGFLGCHTALGDLPEQFRKRNPDIPKGGIRAAGGTSNGPVFIWKKNPKKDGSKYILEDVRIKRVVPGEKKPRDVTVVAQLEMPPRPALSSGAD